MNFRKNCLIESAIFLLVFVAFNIVLFPNIPAYQNVSPHPYLILVILMASLYGIKEGLAACFFSILTFIIQLKMMNNVSLASTLNDFLNLKVFFLLLTAAIVLGEIKEIYNREKEILNISLKEARNKLDKLQLKFKTVKFVKDELETRIIGQSASMFSLYEATKALETLETDRVYSALLNLVVKFIGAKKCSLYLIDKKQNRLINAAVFGWSKAEITKKSQYIEIGQGILGWAAKEGESLTIKDVQENQRLKELASGAGAGESMLCVPIKIEDRIIGMINIEEIPFIKLTASAVRTLSILADLVSPAIENAYVYQQAKEKDIYDSDINIIKYSYFFKRSEEEFRRALRYNLTFSLLLFEIHYFADFFKDGSEDDKTTFLRMLVKIITSRIRSVDILSQCEQSGRLILMLPVTDLHGGLTVAEKLIDAFESTPVKLKEIEMGVNVTFGLSGYRQGCENVNMVIEGALRALEKAKNKGKKIGVDEDRR